MKVFDIVLLIIILIGAIQGYRSGFLLELFSLLAVILGILGGFKLMGIAMVMLDNKFNIDEKVLPYAAFAVVFLIILIIVNLLGKIIKASVSKSFLGSVDQVAGGILGLVRTAFMISVTLWIADSLNFKFFERWTEDSLFYSHIAAFAPKVTDWISAFVPFFKNVF